MNILRTIDLFGVPITFTHKGKMGFSTIFGGSMLVCSVLLLSLYSIYFIVGFVEGNDFTISSDESFSPTTRAFVDDSNYSIRFYLGDAYQNKVDTGLKIEIEALKKDKTGTSSKAITFGPCQDDPKWSCTSIPADMKIEMGNRLDEEEFAFIFFGISLSKKADKQTQLAFLESEETFLFIAFEDSIFSPNKKGNEIGTTFKHSNWLLTKNNYTFEKMIYRQLEYKASSGPFSRQTTQSKLKLDYNYATNYTFADDNDLFYAANIVFHNEIDTFAKEFDSLARIIGTIGGIFQVQYRIFTIMSGLIAKLLFNIDFAKTFLYKRGEVFDKQKGNIIKSYTTSNLDKSSRNLAVSSRKMESINEEKPKPVDLSVWSAILGKSFIFRSEAFKEYQRCQLILNEILSLSNYVCLTEKVDKMINIIFSDEEQIAMNMSKIEINERILKDTKYRRDGVTPSQAKKVTEYFAKKIISKEMTEIEERIFDNLEFGARREVFKIIQEGAI